MQANSGAFSLLAFFAQAGADHNGTDGLGEFIWAVRILKML